MGYVMPPILDLNVGDMLGHGNESPPIFLEKDE